MSGIEKRAAGRPEPLWRPAGEKEVEVRGSSLDESKPSTSKLSQGDAAPPSPRTLKAIEAAMAESSDEEKGLSDKNDGRLSPRTMLAIQEALAEEGGSSSDQSRPVWLHSSPPKLQVTVHQAAPQVVISSSDEEADLCILTVLPSEIPNAEKKPSSLNVHVKDSLLVSSSEDEAEEAIAQRNKAFPVALQEDVEEMETKNKELGDERRTGNGKQVEPQMRAALNGNVAQQHLPISTSAQVCVKPFPAETENSSMESEQKIKAPNEVKLVSSDDSESEGTTVLG